MLLINIVNQFFPAYKDARIFQKEFLLNVQNAYALVTLLCLMAQLFNCVFYEQCTNLMIFFTKFNYYIILDILLCEPIIYFHHLISFALLHIYTTNYELTSLTYSIGISFGMIEISTTFLTIRLILNKFKRAHPYITFIYNINNYIFAITFFYTRIYLYYTEVLRNQILYDIIMQITPMEYYIFNTCLYLLYFLNLYWAYKILQVIVKPLIACIAT
jgi:hypothetical protein